MTSSSQLPGPSGSRDDTAGSAIAPPPAGPAIAPPPAGPAIAPPPADAVVLELHGVRLVDEYSWLRDRDRPGTGAYLRAERAFYDSQVAHAQPLRTELAAAMRRRTPSTDRSVSWSRGGRVYYTRVAAGKDYEQFLGTRTENVAEQLLLDDNLLAEGSHYLGTGVREVSPDGRLLAYSVDLEGDEFYTLRFRDLETGTDLPERIAPVSEGGAWSADSRTFFYVAPDPLHRPFQVWRHALGAQTDEMVLAEPDEAFELVIEQSRSGDYVVVHAISTDTSEAWAIPAAAASEPPRSVRSRRPGILSLLTHAPHPGGDSWLAVTNDEATEFRVLSAPAAAGGAVPDWSEIVPEHPDTRVVAADAFADHVVVTARRDGSPFLFVLARTADGGFVRTVEIHPEIPAGTIRLGPNEEFRTRSVTVGVESYVRPVVWYSVDLDTGRRTEVHRQQVPDFDPNAYLSERIEVAAGDGALVPVTIARAADTPLDGSAPCLLYGYGAYESSDEPAFDAALITLLDQGVVFAHAHIRGGGERGRNWWLDGRMDRKQNTFSDFVAVADRLAASLVDPDRIVCRGLSAGGLLMGAVYSQAPRRWRGVVAEVPFVDVVNTMLDDSVPLTAQEWREWGNPALADEFAWMLAYSPYDNVPAAADRPRLLVTGAVHDARVMYWEPAKWVARLRATGSTDGRLLFRIELGEGAHSGPRGRFAHLDYEAEIYAWVLETFGRSDTR
jgi:oligopeptidase B